MMENKERLLINKIKKLIPDDDQRVLMIMTLMGMSATLVEFILQEYKAEELPLMIKYACAMICGNMIALISDGKDAIFKNIEDHPYEMGEQTQERIYRKMKWVIEMLYENIKEEEKI